MLKIMEPDTYQEMLDTSSDENPQWCKARTDRNDGAGKLFLLRASQFCEPQTCSTALLQIELLVCIFFFFFAAVLKKVLWTHDGTSEMQTCVDGKPRKFHEGSSEIPACQLGAEIHGRNWLAENDVA